MANNGGDARLEKLENTLRGVVPTPVDDLAVVPPGAKAPEIYDLMVRGKDTAKAMRDLAQYSNRVADNLENLITDYVGHMQRLLGRIGK